MEPMLARGGRGLDGRLRAAAPARRFLPREVNWIIGIVLFTLAMVEVEVHDGAQEAVLEKRG